jgi:hypothetical protein
MAGVSGVANTRVWRVLLVAVVTVVALVGVLVADVLAQPGEDSERGRAGRRYYLFDDGAVPIGEFLGQILATRSLAAPTTAIPRWVARIAGSLMGTGWTIIRRPGQPRYHA